MAYSIVFWTPKTQMGSIYKNVAKTGVQQHNDGKTEVKKINNSTLQVTLCDGKTTSVFFVLNILKRGIPFTGLTLKCWYIFNNRVTRCY